MDVPVGPPRRLIVLAQQEYTMVCQGLSKDDLLKALQREGSVVTTYDRKTDFCHYEGRLLDGRLFYAQGWLRDDVLQLYTVVVL